MTSLVTPRDELARENRVRIERRRRREEVVAKEKEAMMEKISSASPGLSPRGFHSTSPSMQSLRSTSTASARASPSYRSPRTPLLRSPVKTPHSSGGGTQSKYVSRIRELEVENETISMELERQKLREEKLSLRLSSMSRKLEESQREGEKLREEKKQIEERLDKMVYVSSRSRNLAKIRSDLEELTTLRCVVEEKEREAKNAKEEAISLRLQLEDVRSALMDKMKEYELQKIEIEASARLLNGKNEQLKELEVVIKELELEEIESTKSEIAKIRDILSQTGEEKVEGSSQSSLIDSWMDGSAAKKKSRASFPQPHPSTLSHVDGMTPEGRLMFFRDALGLGK